VERVQIRVVVARDECQEELIQTNLEDGIQDQLAESTRKLLAICIGCRFAKFSTSGIKIPGKDGFELKRFRIYLHCTCNFVVKCRLYNTRHLLISPKLFHHLFHFLSSFCWREVCFFLISFGSKLGHVHFSKLLQSKSPAMET